jgi:hypothetical protein
MAVPKLTINAQDYYTDDFNEDQMQMYNEINLAHQEIGRMDYLMRVLDARCKQLGDMIVQIAETPSEYQENDGD